jgi:hypothetical protein
MGGEGGREKGAELGAWADGGSPGGGVAPATRRLTELMEEFRHRERQRPDLVVRPWWATGPAGDRLSQGFVVEYCPAGRESAEIVVRGSRVTVDGPGGVTETRLDLDQGWVLGGLDTRSPQTLLNHLLRLADAVLGEAA